jgi:hypothetical protein
MTNVLIEELVLQCGFPDRADMPPKSGPMMPPVARAVCRMPRHIGISASGVFVAASAVQAGVMPS